MRVAGAMMGTGVGNCSREAPPEIWDNPDDEAYGFL